MPAVSSEWDFLRCDNDSLFHLHQIERTLADYPRVPSFDAYSHFPRGFRVHWLAPHTFFYATLVHWSAGPAGDIVSLVPPVLGLIAVALVFWLALEYSQRSAVALLAALLAAVSGECVRPFFIGTIDHHLFAHLGVLVAVLGRLRHRWRLWFAGLLLLCAMTPEALFYVTVLLAALAAADVLAILAGDEPQAAGPGWYLAPALAGALGWAGDRLLQAQPLPLGTFSWVLPTLYQPAWYAVCGLSACGAVFYLRGRSGRERITALLLGLTVVATAALLFLFVTNSLGPIAARLAGAGRLYVGEETSVFRRGFLHAHPWYRLLALSALYALWRLVRAWRSGAPASLFFAWLMVLAALGLGFTEMRHLYIFAPLQLIGFSVAAFAAGDRIARAPFAARLPRAAVVAAVAIAASVPLLLSSDVTDRAANRRSACASNPSVDDAVSWLRRSSPSPGEEDRGKPAYGVFAPWTFGHQVHVLAERPVVLDPFNHTEPESGDWVGDVASAEWLAESEPGLVASLRGLGVRYVVLTNPAEEIVDALRRKGAAVDDVYRIEPDGRLTLMPGLGRFAAFRLFMSGGAGALTTGLVLRHGSEARETYSTAGPSGETGSVSVPSVQIYELLDNAGTTSSANS